MSNHSEAQKLYGKDYYDTPGRHGPAAYDRAEPLWMSHFSTMAETIVKRFKPRTVLDMGCAKGFLVEHLRDLGVQAWGRDISEYAISQVRKDLQPYCQVGAADDPLEGSYDLITCIEIAEHLTAPEGEKMIGQFCQHAETVLFSSTATDFEEPTHINMQPAEYWKGLFARHDFYSDLHFQPDFVAPHALLFRKVKKPALDVAVFSHEPPSAAVARVRLTGALTLLEQEKRMKLHYVTASRPDFDAENLLDCDVFVIHREFADKKYCKYIVQAARALGKTIVFELDDLLINVPRSNPHHAFCEAVTPHILDMVDEADFITVTTKPLRDALEAKRPGAAQKIHILPNFIDLAIWGGASPAPGNSAGPCVVGWSGTPTHDEDLAIIKPAIAQIVKKHRGKVVFKFWGHSPKELQGLDGVVMARGLQPDLGLHARDIVNSQMDLAIAPLVDNSFNQAKSDVKWLEYSICHVPGIFSSVTPYTASVAHGKTGWLVENTTEAWVAGLEALITDAPLRRALAQAAYQEVRSTRCLDAGARQWDALYRTFAVSGPRPGAAAPAESASARRRALASLLIYQGDMLKTLTRNEESGRAYGKSLDKLLEFDPLLKELVEAHFSNYRQALAGTSVLTSVKTLIHAGKSIAPEHPAAAVRILVDAVQTAETTKNPMLILVTLLEAGKAMMAHDADKSRQVLQLARQLAGNLSLPKETKTAQDLLEALPSRGVAARKAIAPAPGASHRAIARQSGPSAPPVPKPPLQLAPAVPAFAPGVAIVIPTFNKLDLVRRCLQAICAQTPAPAHEIIVVDNGSTDGTAQFLKGEEQAGRLRAILNRENAGFARACNQGAEAARADLLLFLNNDTQVTTGWLDALTGAVRRPQTGIAGAKLLYANGSIQHAGIAFIGDMPDHPHRHAPADAAEANQFRELDMVTGACLMIRRELFLQLAGFDESYRNGVEDIDLCLRARAAGWKVVYEPKAVVFHLEGQSAGRFDHVADNLKIFFDRWGKSFDSQRQFIAPKPARTIPPQCSLLLVPGALNSAKPVTVAWEGTFLDFGSLSYVNRQLSHCLAAQPGMELSRVGDRTLSGSASACVELQELARTLNTASGNETQVTIRHQWPPDWSRPRHGALVVIQPWEFGALPTDWVQAAANVDEFWVPSHYVRQVYMDSGVAAAKVFVVPNGVDAEKFHPQAAPMPLATRKKFRFLFVGGTIHRKGPDLLLEAYLKNFTASDDVCLVIKDFGGQSVYAGQTFENQIKAAQSQPGAPEILYLNQELSGDAMPGLYTACHCLVHPYRGEGFGLPVLEAMACGLPVIVTAGGATDDFAGEEQAYRIAARRKSIGTEISGLKLARNGWLLEPDLPTLAARMKWVAGHPEEARRKGQAAGEQARREWTWQRAAQIARRRLQELRERQPTGAAVPARRVAARPAVIALPETARIGHLGQARDLLARKEFLPAWQSTLAALARRPFHCEAWLLLAEIARTAGDIERARFCAKHARELAPNWRPAKKFIQTLPARAGQPGAWPGLPALPAAPRLTVCLITKNEEQFLGACLQSVHGLAHQIVVVDTGSTDGTVEIAKKYQAEVHHLAWNDDFSAARNEALKYATGDWVLSLDADEELLPEHRQTILHEMQVAGVMGYRLPIINQGREEEGRGFVPRLFRNAPGLFFVGRVHEQVFSSIEVRCKEWGLQHVLGASVILHRGYAKELVESRGKVARNLRLLERAVEELPDDPNLVMNLGLELARSGQSEAGLEKLHQALRLLAAQPPSLVVPEMREALLSHLTAHLLAARDFAGLAELWEMPFAKSGGLTASNHFGLGLAYMELKRPAEAAEQMRHCLAKRARPVLSPVNAEILKAGPNHCLALCLCALGQPEAAAQAFAAALAEDPSSCRAGVDFARFQAGRGQPLDALKQLNSLVAGNPGEASVWELGGQIALSRPEFLEFARDWTGEAVKHFPDHPGLLLQRAEALLLTQDLEGALPLWRRAFSPNSSRQMAAVVLCELLTDGCRRQFPEAEEASVSRELVRWYRQLIAAGAHASVRRLHERMEQAREVAPGFVRVWEAATQQARQAMAAA